MTYRLLRRFLPHRVSLLATILILLSLMAVSVFYGFEPQAEFRYQNL